MYLRCWSILLACAVLSLCVVTITLTLQIISSLDNNEFKNQKLNETTSEVIHTEGKHMSIRAVPVDTQSKLLIHVVY